MCVYLVEDECLADVAPAAGRTEVVDEQEQQQHEGDAGRGVDGVDQEHHDGTAHDAQHTRVPREVAERRPGGEEKGCGEREGGWKLSGGMKRGEREKELLIFPCRRLR